MSKSIYVVKDLKTNGLAICKEPTSEIDDFLIGRNALTHEQCIFERNGYVKMDYGVKEFVNKMRESYLSPIEIIYEDYISALDTVIVENGYLPLLGKHTQFVFLFPRSPSTQLVEQKASDGIIYVHPEYFGQKLCVGNSYKRIKDALRDGREKSADEISHELGIPINRVSGRLSEMYKKGIIRPVRTIRTMCGRFVKLWKVVDNK